MKKKFEGIIKKEIVPILISFLIPDACIDLLLPQKGDRVFTAGTISGAYAEFAVAADDTVYTLPEKLDFKQGAALGVPYFTAYRALLHRY